MRFLLPFVVFLFLSPLALAEDITCNGSSLAPGATETEAQENCEASCPDSQPVLDAVDECTNNGGSAALGMPDCTSAPSCYEVLGDIFCKGKITLTCTML